MPLAKRAALQNQRLEILNCLADDGRDDDAAEIRRGLSESPRRLPCKYFYDALGSRLFEEICLLPEYYLTRTEIALLAREAPAIMAFFAEADGDLVELGSGSNQKIKLLLNAAGNGFSGRVRYVPVDISASALLESARELLYLNGDLSILGIIADFTRHLEVLPPGRKLITFLGSTIGNFSDQERIAFLKNIASYMNSRDRFLLGLDMVKPVALIEAAYNDSRGVTAAFNKNILSHLNQAWDGDFNLEDFAHVARFNQSRERVEMYIQATRPVSARLAALDLSLICQPGEVILTETCQKFTPAKVSRDLRTAGLKVDQWFTDSRNWFSLVLLKKKV
jgi:L-histidine N-alpha-methyltransferase